MPRAQALLPSQPLRNPIGVGKLYKTLKTRPLSTESFIHVLRVCALEVEDFPDVARVAHLQNGFFVPRNLKKKPSTNVVAKFVSDLLHLVETSVLSATFHPVPASKK